MKFYLALALIALFSFYAFFGGSSESVLLSVEAAKAKANEVVEALRRTVEAFFEVLESLVEDFGIVEGDLRRMEAVVGEGAPVREIVHGQVRVWVFKRGFKRRVRESRLSLG